MLDVLIVEDDDQARASLAEARSRAGHFVTEAADGVRAAELIAERAFDVVICDVHIPGPDGMALFRRLRREAPGTAVVVMTAFGNIPDAVEALRDGATDYITKPFDPDELTRRIVLPIAERIAHIRRFQQVRDRVVRRRAGGPIVGECPAMVRLRRLIGDLASSDASVLIVG